MVKPILECQDRKESERVSVEERDRDKERRKCKNEKVNNGRMVTKYESSIVTLEHPEKELVQ